MGYPPFRNLIQILVSDPDASRANRNAAKIAGILRQHIRNMGEGSRPHVLGPAPAPLEKLRGRYRVQILVKWHPESNPTAVLQNCFADLARHKISSARIHVDVDPLSLL